MFKMFQNQTFAFSSKLALKIVTSLSDDVREKTLLAITLENNRINQRIVPFNFIRATDIGHKLPGRL